MRSNIKKIKFYNYIQAAVGRNNSVILEKRKGTKDMLKNIKKQKIRIVVF